MPKISVVMPCFNSEKYISESIRSVLAQSQKDLELIIVDDGSNDNSIPIIETFNDKRLVLVQNKENMGPAGARNVALKKAESKYIAILDADDLSHPSRFKIQSKWMDRNHDVGVLGSWYSCIGSSKQKIYKYLSDKNITASIPFGSPFGHSTVMMRNEILKENDIRYDTNFRYSHDYKIFYDLSKVTRLSNLPFFLTKYRVHSGNVTHEFSDEQQRFDELIKALVLKEQLNLDTSFASMLHARFKLNFNKLKVLFNALSNANDMTKSLDQKAFKKILFDNWLNTYSRSKELKRVGASQYLCAFSQGIPSNVTSYLKAMKFILKK